MSENSENLSVKESKVMLSTVLFCPTYSKTFSKHRKAANAHIGGTDTLAFLAIFAND